MDNEISPVMRVIAIAVLVLTPVALVILLANPPALTIWVSLGYALLFIAAGLTLW